MRPVTFLGENKNNEPCSADDAGVCRDVETWGGGDVVAQLVVAAPSRKATIVGREGTLEFLKAHDLQVDRRYQRAVNHERVQILVDEWDDDAFGILLVSRRGPEADYVLDGQHRKEGVIQLGRGDDEVPCYVMSGFTLQEEADVFWRINKRRLQPSHPDTFRARLTAEEPVAMEIMALFDKHFIQPKWYPAYLMPNEIYAFGAVEYLYELGDLDWVLGALREGWPRMESALRSDRLLGMGRFYSQWRDYFDQRSDLAGARYVHLIDRMRENPPSVVAEKANAYRMTIHSRPHTSWARAMHEVYNAHLRTNPARLPDWAIGERRTPRRLSLETHDEARDSGDRGEAEPNPRPMKQVRPKTGHGKTKRQTPRSVYDEFVR